MKELMLEWCKYTRYVLEEISQKVYKKFKDERPELTDNVIEFYVDTFDKNKNGPRIKGAGHSTDIMTYSWDDLEKLIDANFPTSTASEERIDVDMKPIESGDDTLQIFLGDRREKCIALRQKFEDISGESYYWCISRNDSSNMFNSYRFRANEPIFYYVFDTERSKKDIYHAVVIYVNSGGQYFVATADNPGDKQMTWEQISQKMPKLKNLKHLFKHIPLTEKEKKIYNIVKNKMSSEEFDALTYDLKEAYVDSGHKLTENQIHSLFKLDKDLVNKYCTMHQNLFLPLDVWKKLPPATKRKVKENITLNRKEEFELIYENRTEFDGDLKLSGTNITSLPPNLKVKGSIDLWGTKITSLPPGLEVGGSLYLGGSKITSLPADLKVGRSIILGSTQISSLPPGLEVGIDLDLSYTGIESLPPGLKVGGNLNIKRTRITQLPPDLIVRGNFIADPAIKLQYEEIITNRQQNDIKLESLIRDVILEIIS